MEISFKSIQTLIYPRDNVQLIPTPSMCFRMAMPHLLCIHVSYFFPRKYFYTLTLVLAQPNDIQLSVSFRRSWDQGEEIVLITITLHHYRTTLRISMQTRRPRYEIRRPMRVWAIRSVVGGMRFVSVLVCPFFVVFAVVFVTCRRWSRLFSRILATLDEGRSKGWDGAARIRNWRGCLVVGWLAFQTGREGGRTQLALVYASS